MKLPLKCIIVDDEPLAREILEGFVACCSDLSLSASFDSAISARSYLKENRIDLLFLDINLPQLSGVEMMKSLSNPPMVIFTTAYSEYAIDGFEVDAIDYLLKPILFDRFKKAVAKAIERSIGTVADSTSPFIMLKSGKKIFRIDLDTILYFESVGDYVRVHTHGKQIVVHDTIKNLSLQLPAGKFLRIHKSFLIALDKIQYIEGNQVKISDILLPVSQNIRDSLLDMLK